MWQCKKVSKLKGVPRPEYVKQKIAKTQTGKKYGIETRLKISLAKKGVSNIKNKGENNGLWKGDKIQYHGLHAWIKRNKPQSNSCERCNMIKKLDLANISGNYKRDINDFQWLCRKCHMISDGRLNNLKKQESV